MPPIHQCPQCGKVLKSTTALKYHQTHESACIVTKNNLQPNTALYGQHHPERDLLRRQQVEAQEFQDHSDEQETLMRHPLMQNAMQGDGVVQRGMKKCPGCDNKMGSSTKMCHTCGHDFYADRGYGYESKPGKTTRKPYTFTGIRTPRQSYKKPAKHAAPKEENLYGEETVHYILAVIFISFFCTRIFVLSIGQPDPDRKLMPSNDLMLAYEIQQRRLQALWEQQKFYQDKDRVKREREEQVRAEEAKRKKVEVGFYSRMHACEI